MLMEGNARLSGTLHSHTAKTDSLAGTAGSVTVGTNKIDLQAAGKEIGEGRELEFLFTMVVALDQVSTDGSVTFSLVTSANADLSSADILVSVGYAEAALVSGFRFSLKVPRLSSVPMKRYLGYQATRNTQAVTAGSVQVDLPIDIQNN